MRKNILILFCFLTVLTVRAQSITIFDELVGKKGEVIDKVKYEVVYNMHSVVIPTHPDSVSFTERMLLQIGEKSSVFYSYQAYEVDSIAAERMKRGEPVNINVTSHVSWKLFKNYPDTGYTVYLDRIASDRFAVKEPLEDPKWTLVADSTRKVLGYPCHLAVAKFKGRLWEAWYTGNIPIDNGPWKLQGLPGLILSAYDSKHEFTFTAVGLKNISEEKHIEYKGKYFVPVDRKSLNKIYKRYYSDAIGYAIMSYPASSRNSIRITDKNGNPIKHSKPIPYHLIEP